ncbi:MAG: outer membrane protein assembly lipoprotein BamD [Saliniramus fredricksonii]|uniref:Outer membrane protein assembly factor BamD n=1 Tax=Saliniramus fredricksonii TaxID=1653334 RepID=A0A0P7Y2Y0_9HYPH|nr:outer membrane protein assembly factor BamD [Saliniramus fredricksonii]KPQ10808.1 MAG: outer membrane protein assembly lipoprotein BamD [Saliniramus fredricksonii]SCC81034.1 Beta-barrel assembly machine subunit BamD [Saliniramus fredricksonii]
MSFANAFFGAKAGISRALVVAGLGLALAGCDTMTSLNPFDRAERYTPEIIEQKPAEELYNEGLARIESRDYQRAVESFTDLEDQYPVSDWARKALVMKAFAYYSANAYDDAIGVAQGYLRQYPGSEDAAYAQYIMAMAYYDQIPDITRDQERTQRAILAFQELIDRYPDSEYVEDAEAKLLLAYDQLAGKEMEVGRYYLNQRNYTGAINRFRNVVSEYQTTRHVEEALSRLTEAYFALGITDEAQTAAAVLGHNFPESRWYRDAYVLLESGGLEPRENRQSWISRAFADFTRGLISF